MGNLKNIKLEDLQLNAVIDENEFENIVGGVTFIPNVTITNEFTRNNIWGFNEEIIRKPKDIFK